MYLRALSMFYLHNAITLYMFLTEHYMHVLGMGSEVPGILFIPALTRRVEPDERVEAECAVDNTSTESA